MWWEIWSSFIIADHYVVNFVTFVTSISSELVLECVTIYFTRVCVCVVAVLHWLLIIRLLDIN